MRASPKEERISVGSISISHPSRVLDPTGLTKIDLARYYAIVGDDMLPHVRGRPLTLVRWAGENAGEKGGTYLRHAKAWGPSVLRRVRIQEKTKVGEYLVADSVDALVGLAQMDILEIHTWNSVAEDVEHPDRIVMDLDPAPDVAWKDVAEAAREVRARLKANGLASWLKTTGGKGLHVVAPLQPRSTWDASLRFARLLASEMARENPRRYVTTMSKAHRKGRIFVDYLRNTRANTSIAAFSIRARANAPVSVPLRWEELGDVDPTALTIAPVLERLRRLRRDPWKGYWTAKQSIA